MRKMFCQFIVCCLFLWAAMPVVLAKTIMYVPFDNRPVSLENEVDTVRAANIDILVPPTEYLAGREQAGDPIKLWEWVNDNARKADALVLSADALIYGGLVDSRTHHFASEILEWRLSHFNRLREKNPQVPIYVFSTIMCSPYATGGGVQPPYYEKYGDDIFQLTALQDKAEVRGLTVDEQRILQAAVTKIPKAYLNDWLERREKNFKINEGLVALTKEGTLTYLIMGRDDTSPFSQSHKEMRQLSRTAAGLTDAHYASFPGADQLGMVLLARAYNHLTQKTPTVEIKYALGAGAATVASYEDQPIGNTIIDHITAAGGSVLKNSGNPDLVLAVNTPLDGHTEEADAFDNMALSTESASAFVKVVEDRLKAGNRVAVADVAFANGADNALMRALFERGLLDKLQSYSGWNTASNTLGFAIGQGMMAKTMPDWERKRLLAVRYLDDWAYQANIRQELYRTTLIPKGGNDQYLDRLESELTAALKKRTEMFAGRYLWVQPDKIDASFPWNRLFEICVKVQP